MEQSIIEIIRSFVTVLCFGFFSIHGIEWRERAREQISIEIKRFLQFERILSQKILLLLLFSIEKFLFDHTQIPTQERCSRSGWWQSFNAFTSTIWGFLLPAIFHSNREMNAVTSSKCALITILIPTQPYTKEHYISKPHQLSHRIIIMNFSSHFSVFKKNYTKILSLLKVNVFVAASNHLFKTKSTHTLSSKFLYFDDSVGDRWVNGSNGSERCRVRWERLARWSKWYFT